jgi:hypothetical protein
MATSYTLWASSTGAAGRAAITSAKFKNDKGAGCTCILVSGGTMRQAAN